MAKLCRCGKIVSDRCDCDGGRSTQRRPQARANYDWTHRLASERLRAERPLCERCVMLYGATDAKPSADMHHIHSIANAPSLAREASNWLAVCGPCHEAIEGDEAQGMAVKRWSDESYDEALHGARMKGGYQNV